MTSQAQPSCKASVPEVPFIPFFAALTAWALLKFAAEYIVQRVNPQFFEDLKLDVRRKYDLYFGTWLGSIFKVVSITSCAAALFTTPAETDIIGLVRPLSTSEQWCWACRAVIYIQEIPHINAFPELIIHHLLSIGAMIAILGLHIPRRQLYVAWAGLLSEFVSNARRLLKMHGKLSPRLAWWLTTANVVLIALFRVTGCFVALIWSLQSGTRGLTLVINAGSWAIYFIYMIRVSTWEAARIKLVVVDLKRPAKLIIAENWNISLLGVIMGFSFVLTELSTLFIYEANVKRLSSAELHSIAWVALQAVLAGMIGAYLGAPTRQFFGSTKKADHKPQHLSMHGGFLFAAATLLSSPTIADSLDKAALLSCTVLSWPLLDAIGHVGYYFDGVGSGTTTTTTSTQTTQQLEAPPPTSLNEKTQPQPTPPKPQPSILSLQLIAALLGFLLYTSLLTTSLTGLTSLRQSAFLAWALENTLRRVIEPHRTDVTLTSVRIPFLPAALKKPIHLFNIWSFVRMVISIHLLARLDMLEQKNNSSLAAGWNGVTVLGVDILTVGKWACVIGVVHVVFEVVTMVLSRPTSAARGRGRGGKHEGEGKDAATSTSTPPPLEGKGVKRSSNNNLVSNPKFIASVSGLALVCLVALGVNSGSIPGPMGSLEEAAEKAFLGGVAGGNSTSGGGVGVPGSGLGVDGGGGGRFHFVTDGVSTWQFLVSTLGVAVLPVVILQVLN